MYGAIMGDIVGSRFEFDRGDKTKDFKLFTKKSVYTDDTVMSIAVADALLVVGPDAVEDDVKENVIRQMRDWGRRYPNAGYGGNFRTWLVLDYEEPYGSYGNGSAMRVSSVGWLYDSIERTREVARWTAEVTHNHPEGIKGAESVASVIYLARSGFDKTYIRDYVIREFGYDLSRTCDEIRPDYHHVESCQETVPEAITAFLEGEHFTEEEKNGLKIFHLIFAADGSEAGDIYNNYTIKFIEKQYSDVLTKKKFDVIEEIKEKFHLMSSKILKEKIEKNDFISNEEIKEKKIISLKDPEKNIVLKRCFIDELGYQIFKGNGFEPQYNYFKNKDTLDIRVEVPGSVEVPKIGKALYLGDCTHIKINGIKRRDKFPESPEGNIDNTRDFGEFNIDISFKTEDFKIKSEPKEQKIKNGILYIKYELEEDKIEESGTALVVEDEDE